MSVYLGNNLLAGTPDITGKVDLDLNNMNPSQTAKDTIVGWGMPDLTSGVSRSAGSSSSPNVAATDCLVCFAGNSTTNDGSGAALYVYNGSSFVRVSGGMGSGLNTLNIAGNCILPKGTNYYIGCAVFQYCYEFPLKGVLNA